MLSDLAAALAFLVLGLNRFSGPWVVPGGVAIVGFMSCGKGTHYRASTRACAAQGKGVLSELTLS